MGVWMDGGMIHIQARGNEKSTMKDEGMHVCVLQIHETNIRIYICTRIHYVAVFSFACVFAGLKSDAQTSKIEAQFPICVPSDVNNFQ